MSYPKYAIETVMKYAAVDAAEAEILLTVFPDDFYYSEASATEWKIAATHAKATVAAIRKNPESAIQSYIATGLDRKTAESFAKADYPWAFPLEESAA